MEAFREEWPQVEYCENSYDAAAGADGVVIATEWNQFRALELERLKKLLKRPLIVDLRNIYEPAKMQAAGFDYISVGRADACQERGAEA
jgi:UDPglucose 6-dehydrogenase